MFNITLEFHAVSSKNSKSHNNNLCYIT